MKSIKSTVSILATLSATASFGDAIGLVRHKGADGHVLRVLHLLGFHSRSHLRTQYSQALLFYLLWPGT